MSTEKEKMLEGKIYDPSDAELVELRRLAHRYSKLYNDTFDDEAEKRKELLDSLLPNRGKNCCLQGPIYFDYGVFTTVGDNFYANFNLTVLDSCRVTVGDNVYIGPNCTLATPIHPFVAEERLLREKPDGTIYDDEYAKPIRIGSNCWLASNVVVCGNVEIGDNCVIGAGSVVTRSIPSGSLAAGNPCRVIRTITEEDSIQLRKDLF